MKPVLLNQNSSDILSLINSKTNSQSSSVASPVTPIRVNLNNK